MEIQAPVGAASYSIDSRPNQGIAGIGLVLDSLGGIYEEQSAFTDLISCAYRAGILLKGSIGLDALEVIHLLDECTTKAFEKIPKSRKNLHLAKAALKQLLLAEAIVAVHDSRVDQVGAAVAMTLVKPPRPAVESWKLSAVGIGPIRLGMDEDEARAVAPGVVSTPSQFCDLWEVPGPDGVNFQVPPGGYGRSVSRRIRGTVRPVSAKAPASAR